MSKSRDSIKTYEDFNRKPLLFYGVKVQEQLRHLLRLGDIAIRIVWPLFKNSQNCKHLEQLYLSYILYLAKMSSL